MITGELTHEERLILLYCKIIKDDGTEEIQKAMKMTKRQLLSYINNLESRSFLNRE